MGLVIECLKDATKYRLIVFDCDEWNDRYFLSGVLQLQFLSAMCNSSGQGPHFGQPLNRCDLYGSTDAGQRLRYVHHHLHIEISY